MNAHEEFLEIFKYAVSKRNLITLASHLENNWKLLTIVSIEHCESIVCSIFDKKDGLLYFLNDELENRSSSKNLYVDNALKHGFAFLEFFIKNFHKTSCFVRYISEIKDVCKLGLQKKTTQYILKNASKAFTKLIELFGDHENLELTEIAEHFASNFKTYDLKERKWIFCVLGKIIKHKSNIFLQKCLPIIFQQLYYDAFVEHKLQDVLPMEFHKYFDVLLDILDSTQPPDKIRQRLFPTLYKWIKHLSRQDNQQHGKMAKESGITLLSRHMESFQDLVYTDYKHWYDVLRRLSRETRHNSATIGQRALKTFYRIIGQILREQNTSQNRNILLHFQQEFQTVLKDTNLDSTTLQLTIYGFSQMAAPCKMYLGETNVREMYSTITSYALPLCFNEQSDVKNIEKICYYQEELSAILCQISDVTVDKINVLVKFSIYTIKRFPEVDNVIVVSSLIKTICKLGIINKNLLQRYLDDIIFDGIAWSCSHTLAVDAELQRELNSLQQTPICYKNYLPLWTALLKAEKYPAGHAQMVQLVADTLMDVCIISIDRLDLRVKQTEEHTPLSDVALTQSAVNQTDFRVFTNLVDLYVDIIDKSEPSLFINIVHKFLYEIVRFSHKYPLISGFYSLARVGMKIFVAYMSEEEGEEKRNERTWQTQELLSNYVIHTLDMIPAFSNIQLLVACLYLILHAPLTYVENVLPRTLPMFKIAFTIGLSNLELAYTALVALKTWTIATGETITTTIQKRERNEQTNELLRELVPYLEPYLRSTESSVDISQNLILMARKHVKRIDVIDTDLTLRNFQRQVLLFLGSLNHDLLSNFAYDRASRSTGASWDHKDLLQYIVPFPNEIRPKIYFDRILPILMTLARDSSDRRTKIAACEVLHSLVALVAGTTKQNSNDEKYLAIYDDLCPTVVALGCDGDEVVRNLYHPLALQLMHWLSSIPKLTNSVIDYLLDSLTDNLNPAMREFAGMCLAEFTNWSIRQDTGTQTQSNVPKIIQKITNLALHPSANKRIAAAVAFNHLYKILREDDDIISTYWLEIFYCFVRSLDGCDDLSIINALAHIEKVLKIKAVLLNTDDDRDRQKPPEFDKAILTHALYWLLSRCGVLNERCRAKCMELYVNISQYIGKSARETTQTYIDTYGRDQLCDIILRDLTCMKDISVADNVMSLLKALDYYVWLMEKELLPVEIIFPANEDHTIFSCICSFAQQFLRTIREPSTVTPATKLREFELRALQCKALMATFNFLQVLLNVDVNILPESLWTEPLCELIVQCVMCPRTIGFDVKNIEMTDRLPCVLEALLNSMNLKLANLPNNIVRCLLSSRESLVEKFHKLHEIAQNSSEIEMTQKVNGLMLLKRCDMLALLEMNDFCENEGDDIIEQIFHFLVSNRIGNLICRDLTASMIEYLQILMEFRLSLIVKPADVRSVINTLVRLISNDTSIIDFAKITHGDYFLSKFKSVIFKYMLTHRDAIVSIFEEVSHKNPAFLLKWIEDLVLFLKQHRREMQTTHVYETVDIILRQFACLKRAVDNIDSRRETLLNIYGTTVRLKSKPTEIIEVSRELYEWILDQLTRNDSFEYKMLILRNFLICLTDATDRENDKIELWSILQQTLNRNLLSESNAMTMINSFETLLLLLLATKSVITLRCVMHFAAGAGDRLFNEKLKEYLHRYYHKSSSEHVLRSLEEIYRAFMRENTTEVERLDVLRGFLLPSFELCDTATIESFFERHARELHEIAEQCTDNNDNSVKRIIVSKIGYFQLMTIMFSRIDKKKIEDMNSSIMTGKNNKTFSFEVFRNTWSTRGLRITQPDCDELTRRLHCAAYNCSLAIICLKEEQRFYKPAFSQDSDLIWKNIVDCKKYYKLSQTFQKKPKNREITVNIKSTVRDVPTYEYTYIHSYDLSMCTLSEDINAYDFNRSDLLPSNSYNSTNFNSFQSHSATSIILESDDFNEHECMPYIYVLLQRIKNLFGSNNEEPEWLKFFFDGRLIHNHPNIQLFLLKIVWNTADVFKPHAKFALTSIVKITANYLEQYDLNYIVTDILEMLMDWRDTVTPNENDTTEIQKLFEVVVEKVVNKELSKTSGNKNVYKYNLSLIRNMVEKWRSCLQVPNSVLMNKIMNAPNVAVHLILTLLQNNMTEVIVATDDIVKFLLKQLNNWEMSKSSEVTCLQSCECLGLCLKFLCNETGRENRGRELQQKIVDILGAKRPPHDMIKQVKRIAHLCRTCPDVALNYVHIAISAMAKEVNKSYCLEIFFLAMPKIDTINIVDHLHYIKLEKVLGNPICEKMALHIVRRMVTIVSPTVLLSYIKQVIRYVKDNIREHRKLVYDVLMSVHKKYLADIASNDATVQNLLSVSTQNLLAGLIDPCPDLQEEILKFWAEETELSKCSPKDLLIALLDMYSSQVTTMPDNMFTSFMGLLMLQLTTKTRDYTKNMFEQPLHSNSTFENYKIPIFRCRQNLSSMAPIFVDSLASQMNRSILSQSIDSSIYAATSIYSRVSFAHPMRLRATQDSRFEQTLVDEDEFANTTATFDITSLDTEFDRIRKLQPTTSQGRTSARFLGNSSDVAHFRRKQIEKNEQRAEMIKQENMRQQSSVRLCRDYRKGDFPDIQIPHSSLIVPLQQLIKLDRLICKDVTVSLLCALVEDIEETERSDNFSQVIVEKLKQILQKSSERSSSFSAIILETLLKLKVVDCNPRDIMKISKINGLNTLGTLLLEQSLLPDNDSVSPRKRMRRQDDDIRNEETDKWAQLAFLYKSLNDVDVVLSIFRERQSFGQHIQEAALAAASGDWIRAKHAFEMGYKQPETLSMKEHCMQGLLEAVNNLCNWSAIDKLVKSRINRDLNNIWNDSWKDWMIPCVSNAYTYMYGMGERDWSSRDNDMKIIESWMNDRDKMTYLKSTIGENLLMNLLKSDEKQKVTDLLNDLLDKAAEQWIELNPLCAELGIRNLQKLQAISDLDASLKVLRCTNETDRVDRLADLLNFWSTKAPTIRDNLIQWNKLVAFRLFSSTLIEELMDDDNDDNVLERKQKVMEQMRRATIQLRLDVGDAALNQKHRYIAEKYLNCMTKLKGIPCLNMEVPLAWLEARTKSLCADLESDAEVKMTAYTDSWKCSHELLNKHVDNELYTAFIQHIGIMTSKIESYSRENDKFASELMKNTVILQKIGIAETTNADLDTVRQELLRYSLDNLRMCCERAEMINATNVGEHYCALTKHCYDRLMTTDVESDEIFRGFLSSTLKSMRHGYLEAMHYFPCLLKPEHLQHEQTRQIFDQECAMLQPWLFLRWRDLLFSHLSTSIADSVAPIVERLAETYPDAVIYTYYLAIEQTPDILQRTQKLRSLLGSKAAEYKQFLEAIQCVTQPELYLKYHLDEAMKKQSRGEVGIINSLLQEIDPIFGSQVEKNRKNPRLSKVYQQLANYVTKIKNINPDNPDDLKKQVQEIKQSLDKSLKKRLEKSVKRGVKVYNSQLKNYSPFLHEYTGGNIEIPGQYSGDKEPIPCHHVKIARFEPDIATMPSLRKPIHISMIGDNGREYKFLIKFGEDLTIDRGLQQLYATMNRTLRNDASCSQRHLEIDTYEVIPLSRSLGLIQWIEGTKSLEDLVKFSMKSKDTENCIANRKNYELWIADTAPSMPLIDRYKEAISKYSQQTVIEKMKCLIENTKQTALRDTFTAIGTSPECFVTLRRNFVTSYATMCVAHWIAGIGDRHLQNTLIHVATGRCLGIDFGHSFGSGIRAPIPELVPFRLTPQILELLRPFTERDLLATIMTHAMRALRNDRGPILACMDIFVHKPVSRSLDDEMIRENIDTDSTWSSKKNIEVVAKKLNGIHPSFITLEQLKETHNDNKYFTRYQAIVTGNDEFRQTRADKRNDCLTPAEQVDCLLDQAKDLNILGRMYANWQPWL